MNVLYQLLTLAFNEQSQHICNLWHLCTRHSCNTFILHQQWFCKC